MLDPTLPLDEDPPGGRPKAPPGFELLGEVGRGGMGVVHRAHDAALDREVAIKFLQERFDPNSATAARFVEEAHITGQLQHPGVPAVHQVGALSDGRPFLVMKLIKGSTLEELLRQGAAVDPLAIFEAIAQTVGYAHAHGVIHRDLKPANVMVGGFGEVQLMDWGLAKVLAQPTPAADIEATTAPTLIRSPRDADSSQTRTGSVLGTPAYMAPEQAGGEIDKVDARADVFGLGAILCVLLTGKPPFTGKDSESVRLAAVRGQTEAAFARLDASGADPDVIGLCKRCLAFEPSARPATGDAVAAEVASLRRAADERARRAERDRHAAVARAEEQAKRRRAMQWAAAAVIAALLLGVVGAGIGLYRADAAQRATEAKRREAEAARAAEAHQRSLAEAKEAEANAVISFFEKQVLAAGRPSGQEGGQGVDVSLHDAILASLPALDQAFARQPLVKGRLRATLGSTFYFLGDAARAVEQYEQARSLAARHLGPDHPTTLLRMNDLAAAHVALGHHEQATRLFEAALEAQRRVLPPDHPETLASMNNLAISYATLGRHERARKLFEETLAAQRRTLLPDHLDALASMNNLANCYDALGRPEEALKLREEVLAAQRRVLPPDHPDTLQSMYNLANCYDALGRDDEALKLHERTLAARSRALGPEHPDTLMSMGAVANGYAALGRGEEALKLHEQALATQTRVLGPEHPDTLASRNGLAAGLDALGRHEEALKLFEEVLATRRRVLPPDHPDTLQSLGNLATAHAAAGHHAAALKLREEAMEARRRALGPDHPDTLRSMSELAESYYALGLQNETLKLLEEVLAARKRVLGPDHQETLRSMSGLADCLGGMGRHDEALKLRRDMLAAQERVLGPDHQDVLVTMASVADSLVALDRGAEAIALIDECVTKAAGKVVDPGLIPSLMDLRLRHFQKAGDPEGCRATAAMWEGLDRADAASPYNAACFRAVAAATRAKAGGADAERLAKEDADRAMDWLARAIAAGYKDKDHMEKDADLDALRDREDFKKLLAGLE